MYSYNIAIYSYNIAIIRSVAQRYHRPKLATRLFFKTVFSSFLGATRCMLDGNSTKLQEIASRTFLNLSGTNNSRVNQICFNFKN